MKDCAPPNEFWRNGISAVARWKSENLYHLNKTPVLEELDFEVPYFDLQFFEKNFHINEITSI